MKKTLHILYLLFFITTNIFSFDVILNKQLYNSLYSGKTQMEITFRSPDKNNQDINRFLEKLVEFSLKEKINISQYTAFDEKTINIYSTNLKNDSTVRLKTGKLPSGKKFIFNHDNKNNTNQSGSFAFPLSSWKVKYFDISQVENVGIGNRFYINTTDSEILQMILNEFSSFGRVTFENEYNNNLFNFNSTLFLLVILSFVIWTIGIIQFILRNRKRLLLQKIWGYSKFKSFLLLPQIFLKPLVLSYILGGILVGAVIISLGQIYFFAAYLTIYIANVVFTSLIFIMLSMIITRAIYNLDTSSSNIKGALESFNKFQYISVGAKFLVTFVLITLIGHSLTNLLDLKQQVENKSYWDKTKNIYKLNFSPSAYNPDDLKTDREMNNKVKALYEQLRHEKNAFLIESVNFSKVEKNSPKPEYFYTLNTSMKNEIYSPAGKKVIVNDNYLKRNPIYGTDGQKVLDKINDDPNTLNLLVPVQYAKYKKEIVRSYLNEFYFQKVEVDNIYNKEIKSPLNNMTKKQLHINVIYVKNKQKVFTYDSNTGDSQNNIIDPIVQIYNNSVDSSFIGSYATSCLFFSDNTKGSAYQSLKPYLEKTDTKNLINSTVSIYQEYGAEIVEKKMLLVKNIISLIITLILSITFLATYIFAYYKVNAYKLYLKYLFGHSYWQRNKKLIAFCIVSYVLIGLFQVLYYKLYELIWFSLLLISMEMLILYYLSNFLSHKNMNKILKGDKL
ncbi:DUF1430 domain-containing protein [Neobacillus sp. KR4-4]|uniref:DUF1430 domain-containing protein n=1 Tax=Neobacillus sp. KR4-4 TaxID=3344872 RepID=UPI0035CC8122